MTVLVVVAIDVYGHPPIKLLFGGKGLGGDQSHICRSEKQLGVAVVIAKAWPRERFEHSQLFPLTPQRGGMLGVAAIRVLDQRLFSSLADSFSQASAAGPIRCDCWILTFSNDQGHYLVPRAS